MIDVLLIRKAEKPIEMSRTKTTTSVKKTPTEPYHASLAA